MSVLKKMNFFRSNLSNQGTFVPPKKQTNTQTDNSWHRYQKHSAITQPTHRLIFQEVGHRYPLLLSEQAALLELGEMRLSVRFNSELVDFDFQWIIDGVISEEKKKENDEKQNC